MNDVFGTPEQQETKGETPIDQPAPEVAQEVVDAAPPAADTDKHVPLAALEAERGQRRDWKEKALKGQGEIDALRRELEAARRTPQPQQPAEEAPELDPVQQQYLRAETITLNHSERMARKAYGDEEVDKAFAKLRSAGNHLVQQALQAADPWDFVVKEGRKLALLEEIGDDPAAYRARLEAEFEAKRSAEPPKPVLPTSLATARSSGARSAPAFNGPPPMSSLFPN